MNDSPYNMITIAIKGLRPDYRLKGKAYSELPMNSFKSILSDADLADLLSFIRLYLGGRSEIITKKEIKKMRKKIDKMEINHEAHDM